MVCINLILLEYCNIFGYLPFGHNDARDRKVRSEIKEFLTLHNQQLSWNVIIGKVSLTRLGLIWSRNCDESRGERNSMNWFAFKFCAHVCLYETRIHWRRLCMRGQGKKIEGVYLPPAQCVKRQTMSVRLLTLLFAMIEMIANNSNRLRSNPPHETLP